MFRRILPPLLAAGLLPLVTCRHPATSTTIRIAHESDAISLDPGAVAESATHSILSNIYESLACFDKDMRLAPALAVNWSTLDEHTWLIRLRRGVRFHDGRVLAASDVKFTLDRVRNDPASGVRGQLWSIRDVEVVDATTLKLRTLRPDPLLMSRLTYILIMPSARPGPSPRPVGTGPYRFVRWEKGSALEVEAFPRYWGGRPAIPRVRFVPVVPGEDTALALKERRVDVLRFVPENRVPELRAVTRIVAHAGLSSNYLWFNGREGGPRASFSDRRVRQAISLAIDRRRIVEGLGGYGLPANQLAQKGVFGYIANWPALPHDPERARTLLREAGYADGFAATLARSSGASAEAVAEMIRPMLATVGIRLTVETPDWGEMVSAWRTGRLGFFLAGWRFDNGDATSFMRDCLFTRDPARDYGTYNPGFSSPALDRLIDENDQIFDENARLEHYEKAMRLAMEEMPLVPLYHRFDLYGVAEGVRWEPRLDGKLLAAEMSLRSR